MANTTVKGKFNIVAENGNVQTIYPKTTGDQVLVDRSSNASVIPNDVANLQHIVNKMGALALKSKVETSDFTTGTMIGVAGTDNDPCANLKANTDAGKIADALIVKNIESRVDTLENSNLVTVDELDAGLATKPDTEINDTVTSTSLTWSSKKLSDQLTELNSNTQLLNSRVNTLITHNNDTEGNSELIDIRTSTNVVVYDSAGNAVRGQLAGLKNQIDTVLHRFYHVYNLLDIGYQLKNVGFKYSNPDNGGGMIIGGTKQIVIIPVTPGTSYYFTKLSSVYYQIALYNKEMVFISSLYSYHNNSGSWNNSWSIPDTCCYVAVVIDDDYKDTAFWGLPQDYTNWTEGYRYDTNNIEKPEEKPSNHKLTNYSSTIESSGKIELDVSDIKQNYTFSFSAKIPDNFSSVKIGHGIDSTYSGMYAEVTAQEVKFYRYHSSDILANTFTHGIDIENFIIVTINILQDQSSEVIVTSSSGSYKCSNKWQGSKGTIAAEVIGCSLTDCTLTYYCSDYDKKIWAFGDSYFYEYSSDRWPKIVIDNGFTGAMFDGYGGRTSVQALQSLNKCLSFGRPDTILWCMGMNDHDTTSSVNVNWKSVYDTICNICSNYKIRLVPCTIPSTPTINHSFKNDIIRNSGLNYIDIEDTVGVDENGNWYEGMLAGDNIHPTAKGSNVIAAKMMAVFSEIY